MNINRNELKRHTKRCLKATSYRPLLASLLVLALLYVLAAFIYSLTGYMEYRNLVAEAMRNTQEGEIFLLPAWPKVNVIGLGLALSLFLMRTLIEAGYMGYCLKVVRQEPVTVKNLFDVFNFSGKAFLVQLFRAGVVLLYMLPALITAFFGLYLLSSAPLGAVALLLLAAVFSVPGFIISYTYRQAVYILFDHPEMSARQCMTESKRIMIGMRKELLMLDLSFIGWQMLSSIVALYTIPLVEIWIMPYLNITYAGFYDEIKDRTPAPVEQYRGRKKK